MALLNRLLGLLDSPQVVMRPQPVLSLSLLLALGLSVGSLGVQGADASQKQTIKPSVKQKIAVPTSASHSSLPEGVYLQGESPEPQQMGKAYMVFEVRQNRLVGAFYMPHSSFDCFYGSPQGDRLALTVVDSYSQQTFSYAIALNNSLLVASTGEVPAVTEPQLAGFYPISSVSQSDRDMLETCQANLSQQI